MPLIFVTFRHASYYNDLPSQKLYCLVSNEVKD